MSEEQLLDLLKELVEIPRENEFVEFKLNFHSAEEIGKCISALANTVCINSSSFGYLVFGVEDGSNRIVGTSFKAKMYKKGNEDLEHWLSTRLNPKIDFRIHEFDYEKNKHISLFIIPPAKNQPVEFMNQAYIRINSVTRKINDFPEKQAIIWKNNSGLFENEIAMDKLSASDITNLLSTETYFNLMKIPYPSAQEGVIQKFIEEGLVIKSKGLFSITNLGALLFSKQLNDFDNLTRKAVRVIVYKGKNKVKTEREQITSKGYALTFEVLLEWINSQLPANEEIGKALRNDTRMYPEIAIRELVANAIIHQNLNEKGFPMVEIFSDRIEITNAGKPLVDPERFIDAYVSRNYKMADIMRRMGFCEEKGSGMDKVIFYNELFQLPPINIMVDDYTTRVTIYSYKTLNQLGKKEKIRACYQHACLKYVSNEKMTNQTLRQRFKIEDRNYSIASRIIRDTLQEILIKEDDPENKSKKYAAYIPFWA